MKLTETGFAFTLISAFNFTKLAIIQLLKVIARCLHVYFC